MNNTNATNFSVNSPGILGSETQLEEGQITAWTILQVFAYYVMILLSLIGNTVVIKAIKKIGRKLRRQVHYLFIVNLSAADLLFALENIPITCTHLLLNGAWKVEGRFGNFLCQLDMFLSAVFILTSNLTILAISVEKFCGIYFPLRNFVSTKRAFFILASTWLIGGLYSIPLFSFASLRKYPDGNFRCYVCSDCEKMVQWFVFQTILLAIGFVITLALYAAIGIKIWLRKVPGVHLYEVQRRGQGRKYKALKMLTMLVVVFYISFIPFWIYQLSLHFGFLDKLGSHYGQISAFLMFCNGAINPVIYSIYNLDIRREFKCLFLCLHKKSPKLMRFPKPNKRDDENTEMKALNQETTHNTLRKKRNTSGQVNNNEKRLVVHI